MLRRKLLVHPLLLLLIAGGGCAHSPSAEVVRANNPIFVPANDQNVVWERTADVLHFYQFEIEREDRLDGVMETEYKTGSSYLEPWHRETVGPRNRAESTLQSIRRKVLVGIRPAPEGGFLVSVEAVKELEDVVGRAANSPGGATFQENDPLQRDLNLVVGQTAPSGWIPQGRDVVLEHDILLRLQSAFSQ